MYHEIPEKVSQNNPLVQLVNLFKQINLIFKKYVFQIFLISTISGLFCYVYASLQPTKYRSKVLFVVEESKNQSNLNSIIGQLGIDLGSSSGSSMISGDNILLFIKSKKNIRETLISTIYSDSSETFIEYYIKNLKNKNSKKPLIDITVSNSSPSNRRMTDSVIQGITNAIYDEYIEVVKPDKRSTFIEASCISTDEFFSKHFLDKLIEVSTKQYINSKLSLKIQNINRLQKKSDSLALILNYRTKLLAEQKQSILDLNPGSETFVVPSEIKSRDLSITASVYTEVLKNLEISKTLLNQEVPLIQIVDQSTFPLEVVRTSKLKFTAVGAFFAFCFSMLFLYSRRFLSI